MNVKDSIRRSNSWHWLTAVAVLSAAGSVFVPTYGWKDALKHWESSLEPRIKNAQSTLDALKSLDEAEALDADRKSAALKARTEKLKQDFMAYGLDPLPAGDDAVFAAQSRISEALAKRRLRIVSNEANVAKAGGSNISSTATDAQKRITPKAAAKPQMTAAEYRRQVDAQAAKMTDKKLRDMFLADARRQIARMEQAEKQGKGKAAVADTQMRAVPKTAAPRGQQSSTAPSFKTSEIDYKVVGDFRDVFMFFAAETHRKSNYAFRDIAVKRGADGMDVSFTLRVQHR